MKKDCKKCGKPFARNPHYSDKQWGLSQYCSIRCSSRKTITETELGRFFSFVEIDNLTNCWNWTGAMDAGGYGFFAGERAHRAIYKRSVGSVPNRHLVLHRCDNRCCVNPLHLFVGSHKDNSDDMRLKGRDNPAFGSRVGTARLTEDEVLSIRADNRLQEDIARDYGIAQTTVSAIKKKRNWRHLP